MQKCKLNFLLRFGLISILLGLFVTQSFAQNVTITGVVKDQSGEPLIGVNVMEKGTTNGSITDVDGKYSVSVKGGKTILVFSYIGYISQEIPVGNQKTLNVTMKEDTEELEQAVEAGELECGFVFDKEFAKQYEEGSFTDSITYVYTPFTTKGMAVRETVYGTVLELYGEKLLQQNQETIVGQSSEEISAMLADRYEYYLNSDAIFHTEVIYVETDAGMESDLRRAESGSDGQNGDADWSENGKPNHNQNSNQNSNQNHNQNSNQNRNHNRIAGQPSDMENLIRGVISCMIFLAVYLSGASCKEEKNQHFLSILEKGKRYSYECAGMLAAVTPMMLVGTGLSCLTILQSEMLDAASGAGFVTATGIGMVIVTEILQMLLLIVVSILFTACTMCIWKKDMGMLSALPVLILLQIIICPVIFDMAVYVPAVKYIRYLCPIAYYL